MPRLADTSLVSPSPAWEAIPRAPQDDRNAAALKKACREFEALFLQQLLKEMRQTILRSDLLPGQAGQGLHQDLAEEALAQAISSGRGIGLAEILYRQLSTQPR
ncbi:MAG: rod-binding protein [Firmicutes bacterium]|nr:rod-binding protein [Bacillota bacterium]